MTVSLIGRRCRWSSGRQTEPLKLMRILIVGSGGREHALVWALRKNATKPSELFCAPGNAGIAQVAARVRVKANNIAALAKFAEESRIDLTVVGPEAPLAAGIVDEFEQRGLRIVGPGREAARLASSKAFAKDFMSRHRVPTAHYRSGSCPLEAIAILRSARFGRPKGCAVDKADG